MKKIFLVTFLLLFYSIEISAAFSTDQDNVSVGSQIELSWSSQASSCQAGGSWSGTKSGSGSENVTITSEGWTIFSISCAGVFEYVFVWGTAPSSISNSTSASSNTESSSSSESSSSASSSSESSISGELYPSATSFTAQEAKDKLLSINFNVPSTSNTQEYVAGLDVPDIHRENFFKIQDQLNAVLGSYPRFVYLVFNTNGTEADAAPVIDRLQEINYNNSANNRLTFQELIDSQSCLAGANAGRTRTATTDPYNVCLQSLEFRENPFGSGGSEVEGYIRIALNQAHEYFHSYQRAHALERGFDYQYDRNNPETTVEAPTWWIEGAAIAFQNAWFQANWDKISLFDDATLGQIRGIDIASVTSSEFYKEIRRSIQGAPGRKVTSGSTEVCDPNWNFTELEERYETESECGQRISVWAAAFLAYRTSYKTIWVDIPQDYYQLGFWGAFEKHVGMSKQEFYDDFNSYMRTGDPEADIPDDWAPQASDLSYFLDIQPEGASGSSSSSSSTSSLYQVGDLTSDSSYDPFNRYIDSYGLRIFGLDDVSGTFLENVASAYAAMFGDGPLIDSSLRDQYINTLQNQYIFQRVGKGGPDNYGGEPPGHPTPSQPDETDDYEHHAADYIWQQENENASGQFNEVMEHLLHTVTTMGFHRAFKEGEDDCSPWDWHSDGVCPTSQLELAKDQAVEMGHYDISSYAEIEPIDSRKRVEAQEFIYWVIMSEWDYFDVINMTVPNEEWKITGSTDLENKLPLAHQLYLDYVAKILVPPSESLLRQLFSQEAVVSFNAETGSTGSSSGSASGSSSSDSDSGISTDDPLGFSLSGVDADLFNIDSSSGEITFKSSPDYENPLDSDQDNVYEIIVTASTGNISNSQNISITVNDEDESSSNSDMDNMGGFMGGLGDFGDFGYGMISGSSSSGSITGQSSGYDSGSGYDLGMSSGSSSSSSSLPTSDSGSSAISFTSSSSFSIQENSDTGFTISASISGSSSSSSSTSTEDLSGSNSSSSNETNSYSIPTFEILDEHPEYACASDFFSKFINVFGVYVISPEEVPISKMMHSAKVLASYLDNDEDGIPDDQQVLNNLLDKGKVAPVWTESTRESFWSDSCQDYFNMNASMYVDTLSSTGEIVYGDSWTLGGLENARDNQAQDNWDGNLEEIWHIVTDGWADVYPDAFGTSYDDPSELTEAMDTARGGRFREVPSAYPSNAWYGYYDSGCDYRCQAVEYVYWGLMSNMSALQIAGHCENVQDEWRICGRDEFSSVDSKLYNLLNNRGYAIPTNIPDGNYRGHNSKNHAFLVEVKQVNGSNKFALNYQTSRDLTLKRGNTYYFDLSGATPANTDTLRNHPFRLSSIKDGTHGGGQEYLDGITKVGNAGEEGSFLKLVVADDAPDQLFYYCEIHSGMGGDSVITIEDLVNETGINESTNTSSTSSASTTTSSSDTSSTSSSTSTSSSPLNNDPFYATSENVAVGTSITLSWNSSAQSCTAGGTWSGNKNSSGSESVTISTPGWNLFTLSCGSSYEYLYIWAY